MNPSNLDSIDLLQIIGLVTALVIGFLPNVISLKSEKGTINKFGRIMVFIFIIAIITTVFSTIAKSLSDKEDYKYLLNNTNVALTKSNENIEKSKAIYILQNKSINNLEKIQENEIKIQEQGKLLADKSDAVQKKSEQLYEQSLKEFVLQKKITAASGSILNQLKYQSEIIDRNNQAKLMMCIISLESTKFKLYDGLQIINWNSQTSLKKFKAESQALALKLKNEKQSSDSFWNSYKELKNRSTKISDSIDNVIEIHIKNLNKDFTYTISDSVILTKSLKEYFDETVSLLDGQFSNSVLQKNPPLLKIWLQYFNEMVVKRELYYLDKTTINSMKQLKELIKTHSEFMTKVYKNSHLYISLKKIIP